MRDLVRLKISTPASHCMGYEKTIKTDRDKEDILDKINSRRNKIASGHIRSLPTAENMLKMEWSDKLEASAQRWANQCVPHRNLDSKDICIDSDKVNIGQNIATVVGDSPGLRPAILVDVWYMELLNMNASLISRYRPSNQTNLQHFDYFTQLTWAESHHVGCGGIKFIVSFRDKSINCNIFGGKNKTINRLVCNFAPGGNQIGSAVYNEGFPCSRCPNEGVCDLKYPSLCKIADKSNNGNKGTVNNQESNLNKNKTSDDNHKNTDNYLLSTVSESFHLEPGEENLTGFDYFAHLFSSRKSTERVTSDLNTCKDVMPVEDFIDVFKKRLIKDQVVKQFFLTSKVSDNVENSQSAYTDATVAELMSHIYSTKEISTTSKATEPEYFNSTLLVDLVEAVIFKNNDKATTTDKLESSSNFISDVSAKRIKAELGEIQTNSHSTGHYFFPEDEIEQDVKEITESYYDISGVPVSDIVLEIQELKRNKGTKDFLEEILESDLEADDGANSNLSSSTILNLNENDGNKVSLKSFKTDILKKPSLRSKRADHELNSKRGKVKGKTALQLKNCDVTVHQINYRDLLKKVALDLDILKLNKRFHCTGTSSHFSLTFLLPNFCIFLYLY
ncbi:uncharacterized protein [Battus philenor]|uniref:uncharacterized protein n=1 Tax=Battus philenor TaxID=42288 RepID=UPI0035CECE1D